MRKGFDIYIQHLNGFDAVDKAVKEMKDDFTKDGLSYTSSSPEKVSDEEKTVSPVVVVLSSRMSEVEITTLILHAVFSYENLHSFSPIVIVLADGKIDLTNANKAMVKAFNNYKVFDYYNGEYDRGRFLFYTYSFLWRKSMRCYLPFMPAPLAECRLAGDNIYHFAQFDEGREGMYMSGYNVEGAEHPTRRDYGQWVGEGNATCVAHELINPNDRTCYFTEGNSDEVLIDIRDDFFLLRNNNSPDISSVLANSGAYTRKEAGSPIIFRNSIKGHKGANYERVEMFYRDKIRVSYDDTKENFILYVNGSIINSNHYTQNNKYVPDGDRHILDNSGHYVKERYNNGSRVSELGCNINLWTGQGEWRYSDGSKYVGVFSHGDKEGRGEVRYANGDVMRGLWRNGLPFGELTMTKANGEVLKGTYDVLRSRFVAKGEASSSKRTNLDSKVTKTMPSGAKFEGKCNTDGSLREGKLTYESGAVYEGYFKDNVESGAGKTTYSNNSRLEGIYENGYMTYGEYHLSDGSLIRGNFEKNKPTGVVRIEYPDGAMYEGLLEAYKFEGNGTFTYPNGKRLVGTFSNGTYKNGKAEYDPSSSNLKFKEKKKLFGWF